MRSQGAHSAVAAAVLRETSQCLAAYTAKPNLVEQDAGIEISNVEGGYGRKQLNELLQNAADAMVSGAGRVAVVLTHEALYCANEGEALTPDGVEALMASHLSRKRDEQIGRFGLGFKSVLGVSDAPEILSRSGGVRFDRAAASRRIRAVVPDAARTPVLRVGEPVSFEDAARQDPVVEELSWATTVVRLPLLAETAWLTDELAQFPAEFLLFAPHVRQLQLDDRTAGRFRSWTVRRVGHMVELEADDRPARWRVFTWQHRPSEDAIADAGEISGRHRVDVSWAVPDRGRAVAGQFWAYFPTNSRTTLSGIINTAFKTTEDRHDILDGKYNREILEQVLPSLVANHLGELIDDDDPASVLEILPARGREARSWADDVLNDPVMQAVASVPCVPDMDGRLRTVKDASLSPPYIAENRRLAERWAAVPERPPDWVHPTVDATPERRAKATRLYVLGGGRISGTEHWLGKLAASGVRGAQVATQLADLVNQKVPEELAAVRRARVVLAADGSIQPPVTGKIFVPGPHEAVSTAEYVAQELADDPETLAALARLGIGPLDALGRLNTQIAKMRGGWRGYDVEQLWMLARRVETESAAAALEAGFGPGGTPVRTLATSAVALEDCLLPGTVVPSDGTRDADHTIDTNFHADDRALLSRLGAVDGPRLTNRAPRERWFDKWLVYAHDVYVAEARAQGVRVAAASVHVRPRRTASHLQLLPSLSAASRVAMTREALPHTHEQWESYAEARASLGRPVPVLNPALWWLRRHGMVATANGPRRPTDVIAPIPGVALDLLPVAIGMTSADLAALGVRGSVDAEWWTMYLAYAAEVFDVRRMHRLYAVAAARECPRPPKVLVAHGGGALMVPSDDVVVTADLAVARMLEAYADVVLVDSESDADALRSHWSFRDADDLLSRRVLHAAAGDPAPLVDRFPGLRATAPGLSPTAVLQACSDLAIEVVLDDGADRTVENVDAVLDLDTLYVLEGKTEPDLLRIVNEHLRLQLDERRMEQTLEIGRRRETNEVTKAVRRAASPEEKLLLMAGEQEIRKVVPADAVKIAAARAGRTLDSLEIARMARASGDTEVLRRLAPAIEKKGIQVPRRLDGGSTAASFVDDLGLPASYAGSQENRRPATETVMGPVRLPLLHDYQVRCIDRVRAVLRGDGPTRGLIALPTGSGKTRVAVEAVVDHVRDSAPHALIVWIAQTDELCEQAVESWSYVWRATGAHETRLTLNRLWGGNDAARADAGVQVVVATDDKLASLAQRGRHEWLTQADVVVVDEAHVSTTKTYTAVFNWLGRGARQRERPLVGLSATPFRGHNQEQTEQLVRRYDSNLLTEGLFGDEDPHRYLQELGVLARVCHQLLDGMTLTPVQGPIGQQLETEKHRLLESRIDLAEVAADAHRNTRIIDSLLALPSKMTAIVFAASVEHADVLAAVLEHEGMPAASVSSFTGAGERRERVRRFQNGQLRVLTNYNVLSQGFDAPKVGAVYVARPTFSPNRYQQMIGRGLRGPRNGGSEEVLIVNVQDNIDAFGEQLAFHHFDSLWRESA